MSDGSSSQGGQRLYISQGEHATGSGPDAVISTLLGSCVAVCLWDPVMRIGGMNHFLLPEGREGGNGFSSFGANSMEVLLNALIRQRADRRRVLAKVFGGATMIAGLSDAGLRNGRFAMDYLEREKIAVVTHNIGGKMARRLEFWPADGRARLKFLSDAPIPEMAPPPPPPPENDVELF